MLAILPRFTLAARGPGGPSRNLSPSAQGVIAKYVPLQKHPVLFDPANVEEQWLHPEYAEILASVRAANVASDVAWSDKEDAQRTAKSLVCEEARQIFSFPLLRDQCCDMLIEEIEHFQTTGLPARRPFC